MSQFSPVTGMDFEVLVTEVHDEYFVGTVKMEVEAHWKWIEINYVVCGRSDIIVGQFTSGTDDDIKSKAAS